MSDHRAVEMMSCIQLQDVGLASTLYREWEGGEPFWGGDFNDCHHPCASSNMWRHHHLFSTPGWFFNVIEIVLRHSASPVLITLLIKFSYNRMVLIPPLQQHSTHTYSKSLLPFRIQITSKCQLCFLEKTDQLRVSHRKSSSKNSWHWPSHSQLWAFQPAVFLSLRF